MKRLSLAATLVLFAALPASAQIYKWLDKNGKVQYSDTPPPSNIKAETLRAHSSAPSAPAASAATTGANKDGTAKDAAKAGAKTPAEQEQAFRKRQLEASKAQEAGDRKQAQAQEQAERCRRATAAVNALQLGGRQQQIDSRGERVFLDERQIALELAKAREEAATACK